MVCIGGIGSERSAAHTQQTSTQVPPPGEYLWVIPQSIGSGDLIRKSDPRYYQDTLSTVRDDGLHSVLAYLNMHTQDITYKRC